MLDNYRFHLGNGWGVIGSLVRCFSYVHPEPDKFRVAAGKSHAFVIGEPNLANIDGLSFGGGNVWSWNANGNLFALDWETGDVTTVIKADGEYIVTTDIVDGMPTNIVVGEV